MGTVILRLLTNLQRESESDFNRISDCQIEIWFKLFPKVFLKKVLLLNWIRAQIRRETTPETPISGVGSSSCAPRGKIGDPPLFPDSPHHAWYTAAMGSECPLTYSCDTPYGVGASPTMLDGQQHTGANVGKELRRVERGVCTGLGCSRPRPPQGTP